ncbi:CheW protein [Crinalium epipsammum PCC 9333]|uniref:CheW protein n=1 Tax=Crinalium epipsammum PCC 9333 TaxID=1173022 RepID=K9W3G2_9CYAN|nr:chemotaxis protein CheW [Crinalium epipsammum]AFZ14292.1 CheW protein [Crinalium epipsammum PCC 9333]
MLILLFYAGKDLYAIEGTHIVEVIPRVSLRKVQHVPEYMAGLFNYRGIILPVIDLCHLIQGTPSRSYLSTRIIIVKHPRQNESLKYLGLMAERVTETLSVSNADIKDSSIRVEDAPYLSGTIVDEKRIIQCIELERLFSDERYACLLMVE